MFVAKPSFHFALLSSSAMYRVFVLGSVRAVRAMSVVRFRRSGPALEKTGPGGYRAALLLRETTSPDPGRAAAE